MNNKFLSIILFCILLNIIPVCNSKCATNKNNNPKDEKFLKDWEKVDSLENLGLPKSALEIIDKIYVKAKKSNNSPQIIKVRIYQIKYYNQIEDNSFDKCIKDFENDLKSSSFPENSIMQSMLAEMYWMYYENNRWKFNQRSQTLNFISDDITTWDLKKIIDKSIKYYISSLSASDSLKKISIEKYEDIIIKGDKPEKLRPTLYDFLAHRAIDFFSNSEITITKPADKFLLAENFYFAEASDFVKQKISTNDTLSLQFYAVLTLQNLLKFRLNDIKNVEAFIDADLKRLELFRSFSVNQIKDSLYLNALSLLEEKFKTNPYSSEISFNIAQYYEAKSINYIPLSKETIKYKWYNKKAIDICNSTIKNFPSSSGAIKCENLIKKIEQIKLSFEVLQVNISNEKFSIKVNYKNLEKIYIRVASIDKDEVNNRNEYYYNHTEIYNRYLKKSKVVKQDIINLPKDIDYNSHSVELLIDELPIGSYIIFIANNENFTYEKNITSYDITYISNISYTERKKKDGSYDFYVLNRKTGQPLENVTAQIWGYKYNYRARTNERIKGQTFITNSDGYFNIPSDVKDNFYVEFFHDNDYLTTDESYNTYSWDYTNKITIYKNYIFTDRAIYRPGQIIYFKGISISNEGDKTNILPNNTVKLTFYDVNYQIVEEQNLTTNEYGTFSGTFTIPTGLLNGNMQLYTSNGSVYVSVEEYKRPKFEVTILPLNGVYLVNDEVEIKGNAISYSGANLTDATVNYRVVRTPIWKWTWWYYNYATSETEIKNGKTNTNENGIFSVKFNAVPDLSVENPQNYDFNYIVYIDVTDINGETQSTQTNIIVGYTALKVDIEIDEKLNKDNTQKYSIITENLNNQFIPAKGEIKFYLLEDNNQPLIDRIWVQPDKQIYSKTQWDTLFPNNVFEDENNLQNLKRKDLVYTYPFDSNKDKEIKLEKLSQWLSGRYVAEITSKDAFGKDVKNIRYFTVFSASKKELPYNTTNWFTTLKGTAEPGEIAKFLIGSSNSNLKILYEIEHKNSIIKKEWINLNKEQKIIEIPIIEDYRGNISVHFSFIKDNRAYTFNESVIVPYTNKELELEFLTFRDKLQPGEKEEWQIKIKGKKSDKVVAEMMATLYDASLDNFIKHSWDFNIYKSYYSSLSLTSGMFNYSSSKQLSVDFNKTFLFPSDIYDEFNWFGFNYYGWYDYRSTNQKNKRKSSSKNFYGGIVNSEISVSYEGEKDEITISNYAIPNAVNTTGDNINEEDQTVNKENGQNNISDNKNVKIRSNFNETAFFYPQLKTNENGEIIIKFTIPESLTRWKMMGFAHTKDLEYGFIEKELITQKELMVLPNVPRFFREGDEIGFPVKISNVSENELKGIVTLEFFDAVTMKPINNIFASNEKQQKEFKIAGKQNATFTWKLKIPDYVQAVQYRIIAKSDKYSDGEENILPVLTNRILVTETMPLPIRGKQTKKYEFTKLINSKNSTTLHNHKLTLEFTSNPAWYAVQALPYLIEYPYECAEQVFSRYYANTLASYIANSSPKIKRVFDSWKNTKNSESLLSNLEKNQELKSLMLEETPWVLNAQNESQRKKNIGLLFDLNKMSNELNSALNKLADMQTPNGGWPWFSGMPDCRYITQHIVTGFSHLVKLNVINLESNDKIKIMVEKAVQYLDDELTEDYNYMKREYKKEELDKNHLSSYEIQYLYARSVFKEIKIPKSTQGAFDYFKKQAEKYWLSQSKYMQGMIALALYRYDNKKVAEDIIKSLKENSLQSEEMGMYWKDNVSGYYWYEAPIEMQALMIEVFDEVANDQNSVEELKVWLLKQKQTQDWKTTKATVEAVYALLLKGTNILESDKLVEVSLGNIKVEPQKIDDIKIEAGTGYFKTSWSRNEINPDMGNISVTKSDDGVAWGAVYWQYFEQLDKITPAETPLKLNKKLFLEKNTASGKVIELIDDKTQLHIGDKVIVRIELRVDRYMEYIHMKDMRAAGFEPINVISRYKYQDGLGYYETTKDASTNFFFSDLPKGTYVFEYPLRVTHNGNFSNGITSIQCMYAPEFSSHSEGIRVKVE